MTVKKRPRRDIIKIYNLKCALLRYVTIVFTLSDDTNDANVRMLIPKFTDRKIYNKKHKKSSGYKSDKHFRFVFCIYQHDVNTYIFLQQQQNIRTVTKTS